MKKHFIPFALLCGYSLTHAVTLPTQAIVPYDCKECSHLSHVPAQANWRVDYKPLKEKVIHQQISRKYHLLVDAKQLQQGVALHTQGKEAIIHIQPLQALTQEKAFFLKTSQGKSLNLKQASKLLAEKQDLAHSPFKEQMFAIQLKKELGTGPFTLSSDLGPGSNFADRYMIFVYDKNAPTYLTVKTDKARYRYGDQLTITVSLQDETQRYPIDSLEVALIGPNHEKKQLQLEHQENSNLYTIELDLNSVQGGHGDNWYVSVNAKSELDQDEVLRHAHTALSYMIPSATLKTIQKDKNAANLSFTAALAVSTDSRYAVEAILFGSDEKGKAHPIQLSQSADWLSASQPGTLHFTFDSIKLMPYKPPFYLGNIRVLDYGQLKPVYEYNTLLALNTFD